LSVSPSGLGSRCASPRHRWPRPPAGPNPPGPGRNGGPWTGRWCRPPAAPARHDVIHAILAGADVAVIVTVEYEVDVASLEVRVEQAADALVVGGSHRSRSVSRVMEEDDAERRRLRSLEVLSQPLELAFVVAMPLARVDHGEVGIPPVEAVAALRQ